MQTCDLFVIGGGSGGVRAGRLAAQAGARVVLAENQNLGGTCVNLGCVPKKLFVYAADFSEAAADAAAFGWTAAQAGPMEWPVLRENKNREIARLNRAYQNNLEKAGVEVLSATARISGPNSVVANEREYRAEKILVAVGAKPVRLAIPGAEVGVVSDDMFHLESLPRRAVVVGGGYIALEFAGILAGLGVETTLCFRADLPLRGFDDDLRRGRRGRSRQARRAFSSRLRAGAGRGFRRGKNSVARQRRKVGGRFDFVRDRAAAGAGRGRAGKRGGFARRKRVPAGGRIVLRRRGGGGGAFTRSATFCRRRR